MTKEIERKSRRSRVRALATNILLGGFNKEEMKSVRFIVLHNVNFQNQVMTFVSERFQKHEIFWKPVCSNWLLLSEKKKVT